MPPYYLDDEVYDSHASVNLNCLMPNGIIVPLQVTCEKSISEIKEKLWASAQNYPLYSKLQDKSSYILMCVTSLGERVECLNEEELLENVKPFQFYFKVVEKQKSEQDINNNTQISALIGTGLHQYSLLKSEEVADFRRNMRRKCESLGARRDRGSEDALIAYMYPPDVCAGPPGQTISLPSCLLRRLQNQMLVVNVLIQDYFVTYTIEVPLEAFPTELIQLCLAKGGFRMEKVEDYLIRVSGRREYLLGEYQLYCYKYLRKCLARQQTPSLELVNKSAIREQLTKYQSISFSINSHRNTDISRRSPVKQRKSNPRNDVYSWDLVDIPFSVTVKCLSNLQLPCQSQVQLVLSVYHGPESMCAHVETRVLTVEQSMVNANTPVTFDINVCNLPRSSRLCISLYERVDRRVNPRQSKAVNSVKQTSKEIAPIGWCNITVFDYKEYLRHGITTLYMWPYSNEQVLSDELLHPIGSVVNNPDCDEAVSLRLFFDDFNQPGPIRYPDAKKIKQVYEQDPSRLEAEHPRMNSDKLLKQLQRFLDNDPLSSIPENNKPSIWFARHICHDQTPQYLPKLLDCVAWNDYKSVAQLYTLLDTWPFLEPPQALQLLDFAHVDKKVRYFAIESLKQSRNFTDQDLLTYLLQLVQVIKYEAYLECHLVKFLLERALRNKKIGHFLFWMLKSEMHVPSVSVRFGLILEAYCRGSIEHLRSLSRQLTAVQTLHRISCYVKEKIGAYDEKPCREAVQKQLMSAQNQLTNFENVLDPAITTDTVNKEKCHFKNSKMRPLFLIWKNKEPFAPEVNIIYKNGDDLRQDMLTLQILHIMDNIWQQEANLDLRLSIYNCLTTGRDEGLIEPVLDAKTIAKIQSSAKFNKRDLYNWLAEKNAKKLDKAIEEFTLSCAGYCVATYVLGIGDRHSDNIMLKSNGQLFHIDFGHILGNFKSKFGIRRERVPFVLTTDMVYIIQAGDDSSDNDKFQRFQTLCENAFLALRKQSYFLITLFKMMINTGIPEVSSVQDIEYLRDTLQPHLSTNEALAHFRSKFKAALKNGWTTRLNWFFHKMAKG